MQDNPGPDKQKEPVMITDDRLIEIVEALNKLSDSWKDKLQQGTLKLQDAVLIGRNLDAGKQQRYKLFLEEHAIQPALINRVIHAFALGMSDWAVWQVVEVIVLADKVKIAAVMYNDIMEVYEQHYHQFEYDFWEGTLPDNDEELEQAFNKLQHTFQQLHQQATEAKRKRYNQSYGDSSSYSSDASSGSADKDTRSNQGGGSGRFEEVDYATLLGLPEATNDQELRRKSRQLLKKLHPDHGGSAYLFDWVKKATDNYRRQMENNSKL